MKVLELKIEAEKKYCNALQKNLDAVVSGSVNESELRYLIKQNYDLPRGKILRQSDYSDWTDHTHENWHEYKVD